MARFFVPPENIRGGAAFVNGPDARHIARSLRMRVGERVTLCCQNTDYLCELVKIRDELVELCVLSESKTESEPDVELTLYQALPKSDKLDFIVQKAVELGAYRIVPVLTERCISRPSETDFKKRLTRLQKISEQAAKQSGRGIIPEISGLISFKEYLSRIKSHELSVFCYEEGGARLCDIKKLATAKTVGLFIGSEGGIAAEEAKGAMSEGAFAATLGKRILRCETAPLCAMSIIMSINGNI